MTTSIVNKHIGKEGDEEQLKVENVKKSNIYNTSGRISTKVLPDLF
jgi:hypothetical protein